MEHLVRYRSRQMSHQVTITRTTTSTTTSAILINTGYLKSWTGLLKLFELLLGTACVGMICYVVDHRSSRYYLVEPELFFMLMSVTFLIGTFCLLLSCILSLSAGTVIAKTIYEVIYHGIAFILYLAASLTLLIEVQKYTSHYASTRDTKLYQAASIVGLVNTALYLVSTVFAYRSYKFV